MTYTEIITIIVAIVGTVAAVYNIRLVALSFRADHERRKKQATIEYVGQTLREARFKIDALYRSKTFTKEEFSKLMANSKDYAEWRNALGVFEHLAVGINAGVYDIDILYRMSGSYITEIFSVVKPYVEWKREKYPFAYTEFENLVLDFKNRHEHRELVSRTGNIRYSR